MKKVFILSRRLLVAAIAFAILVIPTFAYSAEHLVLVSPDYLTKPANRVISTTSNLYVRNGPGTKYSKKGYITGGSLVYVSSNNGKWGYVPAASGYICLDYTKTASFIGSGSEIFKTHTKSGKNVMLRKGPSTSFSKVTSIPNGTKIVPYYYCGNWTWVKYSTKNNTYRGWICSDYITFYYKA